MKFPFDIKLILVSASLLTGTLNGPVFGQGITFVDSVFYASPYKPQGIDQPVQDQLDAVNNQSLTSAQSILFHNHTTDDVNHFYSPSGFGSTYFENEKSSYPFAMHSLIYALGRNQNATALAAKSFLQFNAIYDLGSDLTDTVDLFPSFTLKGQVPKYFYFGKHLGILDTSYLSKMRRAMSKWTHDGATPTDPLLRGNPYFTGQTGCWDPRCRNSWVDTRNTDNLKAMRETSVYLFSEEIGNETIKDIYANRLRNHVGALWNVGFSEWDSENYLPHAMGPFFNLFSFTKTPLIKQTAKAGLDWYFMASAMKYFNGMAAGPTKRLNNSANIRLGGNSCDMPYLYFGEQKVPEIEIFDRDRDGYINFLSQYRPAQAIYQLASKKFRLPVEIRTTKPPYGSFTPGGASIPDVWETMYYGKTYQMGSAISFGAVNDMRPFKLAAFHPDRGADIFFSNTTDSDTVSHAKYAGDQIGQFENMMVFLHKNDTRKFFFQIPLDLNFDTVQGIWFFQYAKTWIAIRPLNIKALSVNPLNGIYAGHKMVRTVSGPGLLSGFAMEVVDDDEYPTYEQFKTEVLARPFDASHLQDSLMVRMENKDGKFLKMYHNSANLRPLVYRNSSSVITFTNANQFNVYQSITPPSCKLFNVNHNGQNLSLQFSAVDSIWGPVFQNWKSGKMKILTNDHYFEGNYNHVSGEYLWKELPANDELRKGRIVLLEVLKDNQVVFSNTDSSQINNLTGSLSFPFGESGGFNFQIRIKDEEGNEAISNPIYLNVTSNDFLVKKNDFVLYPNPASSMLTVSLPVNYGEIEIFKTDGILVKKQSCLELKTEIELHDLPDGLFWVKWKGSNQNLVKAFLKTAE